MHADEIAIDTSLVRRLVARQFPQYAHLELSRLTASGSSNMLFRLGSELLVRLPRQPGGGAAIGKEHCWSSHLQQQLPVAVPEIVAVGQADEEYGERFSIVRWQVGVHPAVFGSQDFANPVQRLRAEDFAGLLKAFAGMPVPEEALAAPELTRQYRGLPLAECDHYTRKNIQRCRELTGLDLDLDAAALVWDQAMGLPGATGGTGVVSWFHGDMVAENLLMTDGRLCGLLDFGGLGIGDPTVDLHGAWEFLDALGREILKRQLAIDDAQWLRGRAWALAIALMTFPYYWASMPDRVQSRLTMARAVLADAAA